MARRNPPRETQFKPGVSGNPKGRPKDAFNTKLKQLTAEEFAEIANLIVKGSVAELKRISKDPGETALRVMIASVAVKAIACGNMAALDGLLNRIVGKVKDKVELSGDVSSPVLTITLPDNGFSAGPETDENEPA